MGKLFVSTLLILALVFMIGEARTFDKKNSGTITSEYETNLTVNDIAKNADKYLGKTVTVSGKVEKSYGPGAFTIERGIFPFDDELLVVGTKKFPIVPDDDDVVQVTGTVHKFVLASVKREINWDFDPQLEAEFKEGSPVIIANSVQKLPTEE